jgi:hypothetical protein
MAACTAANFRKVIRMAVLSYRVRPVWAKLKAQPHIIMSIGNRKWARTGR